MNRVALNRSVVVPVFIALLALSMSGCERAKTRLDREVDRLCAVDGGVHIYETVKLSKENFGPDGEVFPQYRAQLRTDGALGPDFKWASANKLLIDGDLSLTRWEQVITRREDGRVLGKRVVYIRGGGDLPGPWARSQHSCKDVPHDLTQQVFLKEASK